MISWAEKAAGEDKDEERRNAEARATGEEGEIHRRKRQYMQVKKINAGEMRLHSKMPSLLLISPFGIIHLI